MINGQSYVNFQQPSIQNLQRGKDVPPLK